MNCFFDIFQPSFFFIIGIILVISSVFYIFIKQQLSHMEQKVDANHEHITRLGNIMKTFALERNTPPPREEEPVTIKTEPVRRNEPELIVVSSNNTDTEDDEDDGDEFEGGDDDCMTDSDFTDDAELEPVDGDNVADVVDFEDSPYTEDFSELMNTLISQGHSFSPQVFTINLTPESPNVTELEDEPEAVIEEVPATEDFKKLSVVELKQRLTERFPDMTTTAIAKLKKNEMINLLSFQ